MDFDKIVREWFYRLPKGYADAPYSQQELAILDEVMTEQGVSLPEAELEKEKFTEPEQMRNEADQLDQAFNDAKPVKEATQEDFYFPEGFEERIRDKEEDFNEFLAGMPGGATNIMLQNFFDNMTNDDIDDFIEMLYSRESVDEIDPRDYNTGVGAKLYNLEPKGIGRGEIFLAALIRGAKVSGGGQSFDLTIGPDKYEVKDYRTKQSAAIRLGTKGNVVRFPFWKQLIETLEIMEELQEANAFESIDNPDIKAFAEYLNKPGKNGKNRYEMIPTGEFNKTDLQEFEKGFKALSDYAQVDSKGYTMVTLRGPNVKPKAFNIEELPTDIKDKVNLNIKGDAGIENLATRLRRLSYVRSPQSLEQDIDQVVKQTVGDEIPFVVFRPDGIKITKDFELANISQGGIKIMEK